MDNYKNLLNKIKAFVFDVDGVLTDGSLLLLPDGSMCRSMNTKDGYALQLAIKKGYFIAIITGGRDSMVAERLKHLGITDIYLGSRNKIEDLEDFIYKYQLNKDSITYMGDDMPDLEVMKQVALASCPQDAIPEIREMSHYISPYYGGKGCVRDIIEQVMKVQSTWNDVFNLASV